jgi:hypothetical protein
MFDTVINYCKNIYKWNDLYAQQVLFEYERFLDINFKYNETKPSNDINKLWKCHILYTKNYYDYCIKKYNIILDYDPDSFNEIKNVNSLIKKTIQLYMQMFDSIKYPNVWNINLELVETPLISEKYINAKVIYVLDKDGSYFKDKKSSIIKISINDNITISDISKYISLKMNHLGPIYIYPSSEQFKDKQKETNPSDKVISLYKNYKYFIIELLYTLA